MAAVPLASERMARYNFPPETTKISRGSIRQLQRGYRACVRAKAPRTSTILCVESLLCTLDLAFLGSTSALLFFLLFFLVPSPTALPQCRIGIPFLMQSGQVIGQHTQGKLHSHFDQPAQAKLRQVASHFQGSERPFHRGPPLGVQSPSFGGPELGSHFLHHRSSGAPLHPSPTIQYRRHVRVGNIGIDAILLQRLHIVIAVQALPDDTVVDGEIVALDTTGRPSFNSL